MNQFPPTRRPAYLPIVALALAFGCAPAGGQDPSGDPGGTVATRPSDAAAKQRAKALYGILTITALLAIAFLLGSSVMIRAGRALTARRRLRKQTEYIDAWSRYRLTDEQLREYGHAPDHEAGDDSEP
jgi:hypothetical protein